MRQKLISFPLFIIERDFQQGGKHAGLIIPFTSHLRSVDFTEPLTGKQDDPTHKPVRIRLVYVPL